MEWILPATFELSSGEAYHIYISVIIAKSHVLACPLPSYILQVNIIGINEDVFLPWFGLCESRLRILIAGLETPSSGVRAYPFAKFFHTKQESDGGDQKYVASFFIALRYADNIRKSELSPLVSDYIQIVNSWEERGPGMDLTIHDVPQNRLPSFVFLAPKSARMNAIQTDANPPMNSNRDAHAQVRPTTTSNPPMNSNADAHAQERPTTSRVDEQGARIGTPKHQTSQSASIDNKKMSPSAFISPLKRARLDS